MKRIRRYFSKWQNWLGPLIVLIFVSIAITAPVLSPEDPKNPGAFKSVGRVTDHVPHPPSGTSILGTLPGQFDVFHTLIWGARNALFFGLLVASGSFIFGVLFGAIAGNAGGFANGAMMRVSDAFLTFPSFAGVIFLQQLFAITITSLGGDFYFNTIYHGSFISFLGTPTPLMNFLSRIDPLMVTLILFSWMPYARLVNTITLTLKQTEFVQASHALGASPFWIIFHHLVPNSIGPAVVLAARDVGSAVIIQATFTYIGLGGNSPWGNLLSLGRDWVIGPNGIFDTWWVFLPVTLTVILFGVGWNLLGDSLYEFFDPNVY
jgi:peptide/nickel transport system permease protein